MDLTRQSKGSALNIALSQISSHWPPMQLSLFISRRCLVAERSCKKFLDETDVLDKLILKSVARIAVGLSTTC